MKKERNGKEKQITARKKKPTTVSDRSKRRMLERDEHRQLISEMYLRGHTFRQIIAAIFDRYGRRVSTKTVFDDVKAIREDWKAQRIENLEESIQDELKRIAAIEVAAWEAWFKSQSGERSFKAKTKPVDNTKKDSATFQETTLIETSSPGDARFLAIITKCSDQRSRLLGLYKQPNTDDSDDQPVKSGMIPASFINSPTFVIVGGSKPVIESEDQLPE